MASLPIYLYGEDVDLLISWLNAEEQIAFLVPDGEKRWKAVEKIGQLADGRHMLWHVPSGPLPLPAAQLTGKNGLVRNPWKGWTERRTGVDPIVPWFGAGHPGVIELDLWPNGVPWQQAGSNKPIIGLSHFGWIGNYYRIIGRPADPETERWWQRLRRWVAKVGHRIPRADSMNMKYADSYAFPAALKAISGGMARSQN